MSGQASAYEYDGFGNTLRESGPYAASNPFRYSTKYTDTETGLVYYGMRYYSPSLGRFINKDPSEEAGGLNLYGFCANNAVNRFDRLGLDATGDDFLHYYLNDGVVDSSKWTDADWQAWSNYSWGIAQERYDGIYNGFDGHSPFAINSLGIAGGRTDGFFTARQNFAGLDNLMASTDPVANPVNRTAGGSPDFSNGSVPAGRVLIGTPRVEGSDGWVAGGSNGGNGDRVSPAVMGTAVATDAVIQLAPYIVTAARVTARVAGPVALVGTAGIESYRTGTWIDNTTGFSTWFADATIERMYPTHPIYFNADKAPGVPTAADGFEPKKNWDGKKVPSPNGGGYGYPDSSGNVWVPTGTGPLAHGGPHWDVQEPGGGYRNVFPEGGAE